MSNQNSLKTWLKPSDATALNALKPSPAPKRKRTSTTVDSIHSHESEPESENESNKKKPKVTKKANSVPKKASTKKVHAKKASEGAAEQLYKKIIGNVDKKVSSLDVRVKKMGPNSTSVTSDHYAEAMTKFMNDIKKLMVMGQEGARHAFNAMLYVGPYTHGDFYASIKMCGYGGTEEPFAELDEVMLEIIALREDVDCGGKDEGADLPKVSHRWTVEDAHVGVFKTGRPNKQQRGQIERHRAAWIKERNQEARERREKVGDWVENAVEELKSERAAIEVFGLEGYFEKSLAKLEELRSRKGDSVPKEASDQVNADEESD
jgi:hypothetical protein